MDRMEIDSGPSASPRSPRNASASGRRPQPPVKKRVAFALPPPSEVSNPQKYPLPPRLTSPPLPPPPPAAALPPPPPPSPPPADQTIPPSVNLLPSIFLPFHGLPTPPSSTPATRQEILVQTIDNLALQTTAMKRFQIYLTLQERDRILAAERAERAARLAREEKTGTYTHPVADAEMDSILARLSAPPEPGKKGRDYEHPGGKWILDPAEREVWKRPRGEEFGRGTAEKLLEMTVRTAAGMRRYEIQGAEVVGRKKRALESEMRRMGEWEGVVGGGEGGGR